MTYTAQARQFMEAKTNEDLLAIIETASDPYLTSSPDTRNALNEAAKLSREILSARGK